MNIYDILQLTGGLILSAGYFPQIIQILKTKSVRDLNPTTFRSICIGVALMEVYALNLYFNLGTGLMFLVTNSIALTINLTLCGLIGLYRGSYTGTKIVNNKFNIIR